MRRRPHSVGRVTVLEPQAPGAALTIDRNLWADTRETALILKRFKRRDRTSPSMGAIRTMVWRKQLKARKFLGRLLFYIPDLEKLFAGSPFTKGDDDGN